MPVHTVRRTGRPRPKSNYELFNCNNLNIRYWSWNYRGCWPFADTEETRCRPGLCGSLPFGGSVSPPSRPRRSGSLPRGSLSHRLGLARTSSRLGYPDDRCLGVRYDGSSEVAPRQLATGSADST